MLKLRKAFLPVLILFFSKGSWAFFQVDWKDIQKSIESKNYNKAIKQLKKIKTEDSLLGNKHFALGKIFLERKEKEKASWHFRQYFFYEQALSVYTYFYLGQINFQEKKIKKAKRFFLKSLAENPNRFLKRQINLYLAKIDMSENKYLSAYRRLKKLEKRWRKSSLYPDVVESLAITQYHRKKHYSTCHWIQKLYTKYIDFENIDFKDGYLTLKGFKAKCVTTLKDQMKRIRRLQWAGLFETSWKEIELLRKKPTRFTDYELDFLQAYHLTYEGHLDQSSKILKKYEKEKWSNWDYLIFVGKVAVKSGDSPLALKSFYRASQVAKSLKEKKEALFDRAFVAYQFKMYEESYKQFLSFYEKHSSKESLRKKVLWYLGWTQYLNHNFESSLMYFEKLLKIFKKTPLAYESSIEKVSYWKAMAMNHLKQYDKAQKIFMKLSQNSLLTYYSFLSYYRLREIAKKSSVKMSFMRGASVSDFLDYQDKVKIIARSLSSLDNEGEGGDYEKSLSELETKPSRNSEEDDLDKLKNGFFFFSSPSKKKIKKRNKVFFNRASNLKTLGFKSLAIKDFYEVEVNTSDLSLLRILMGNYHALGAYHRSAYIAAIYFSKTRSQYGIEGSHLLWSHAYPEAYKKYVVKYTQYFFIPKELVWSIMRAETFYRFDAVSPVGARGLMQLMPYTGQKIASLSHVSFSKEKLFSPRFNIHLGSHYLYRLRKKFKRKIPLIVASYNAGPHNLENWIYRFGDLSVDSFIEHIPFLETRRYVKKVIRNYGIYSLLYGRSSFKMNWLTQTLELSIRKPSTRESWEPI